MKYDYAIYIGRFQPFHVGHQRVVEFALQRAHKLGILVGSSNLHISPKNPWTFEEREGYIKDTLDERGYPHSRYSCVPLNDIPYNDTAWITQVRELVSDLVDDTPNSKICLVGFQKDSSSEYTKWFPEWDFINVPQQYGTFNATDIRNQYFVDTPVTSEFLAREVRSELREFAFTDKFKWLLREQKFLADYHKQWGTGPFITTDSVVTQKGSILLVRRKFAPYQGALALPGGFLNPQERIMDGCVRELKEETRIADKHGEIPIGKLKSYIKGRDYVFDDPARSARGRIITHAFHFELPDNVDMFKVRGDDDAESAQWYSLHDLNPRDFMEDHWFIIQQMTGIPWK